ncbi:MAG: DUF4147 domain-containing protein [Nitrosopumilaceae archaeon]|nr:DUF4147 domain-containing protein [Nitrosopumilaceae archaeon]NIU00549.1 DUF4147 domain-containing protein [Nitrosopumilaceae archaeon]NIU86935.1 DUF4147 domain-containing protein [Nitrosopumilaceae archaeon]NIV66399.1 DUF4147 domain-containing protein [Nitrosopumilaceae archaeon]NIX61151.1 DUF4147 domain-containing protein [Nitrosopumilaceae archaeon]
MYIQNLNNFPKNKRFQDGLKILDEGIAAADPKNFLKKFVKKGHLCLDGKNFSLKNYEKIYLVAFGKAADSMVNTVNGIIKNDGGIIVIPRGTTPKIKSKKFKIFQSGHPKPNQASIIAAKSIISLLKNCEKNDLVIFLVSGGGSALLSYPDGITLAEKQKTTDVMLKEGLRIQEINCIRKHLSKIKGGRLVQDMKCDGISLVMSDVEGDDLSSIASGCTYFDNTTYNDALSILKKYHIKDKIPKNILAILEKGRIGKIKETPKKKTISNTIVASNEIAIKQMQKKAIRLGYKTRTAQVFVEISKGCRKLLQNRPKRKNSCLIFGGETTVKITGGGRGGRNQELVLRFLKEMLKTKENLLIGSIGTDGIDGNTSYAGAITDLIQIDKTVIEKYLKENNSNAFFKKYGGLVYTGNTHTNIIDIGLIIK